MNLGWRERKGRGRVDRIDRIRVFVCRTLAASIRIPSEGLYE